MPEFQHYDLKLINPTWNDPATDLIMNLEHFRKREIYGSTEPYIFFQLKQIFHSLESLGSARIEGNNTTLTDLIETKINVDTKNSNSKWMEIDNMEKALEFIDKTILEHTIDRAYICHLHALVTKGLPPPSQSKNRGEGDKTPGIYRQEEISINGALHKPPSYIAVDTYMDELFNFINSSEGGSKNDLLRMAIAHHRFMWIHPFNNGNGRTGRLFTYAMLVKQGFTVSSHGTYIINPTAIFCEDRKKYYEHLSIADSGENENVLKWCNYVLAGLNKEIEKIDRLLNIDYLKNHIIFPAIEDSFERKIITDIEKKILKRSIEKEGQIIKALDIKSIVPHKSPSEISRIIKSLVEKEMLMPVKENGRYYHIRFMNNYLLRGIAQMLQKNGFIPIEEL